MEIPWLEFWNNKYNHEVYAYGEEPNEYLKVQLDQLKVGNILFPAEGEGRNAVYAAKLGWTVSAFDISIAGKNKALQLAKKNKVSLDYQIGELPHLDYQQAQFDAIALIYAHFPPPIKAKYHQLLSKYLKKNGIIIFEAFSKNHLDYQQKNAGVGGPKNIDSLFSIEELKLDFHQYTLIELEEKEVELKEGLYHNGLGSVIRFVGQKK